MCRLAEQYDRLRLVDPVLDLWPFVPSFNGDLICECHQALYPTDCLSMSIVNVQTLTRPTICVRRTLL